MKTRIILSMLLLSTAFISPASANWFSNPQWGINRFIGSAPNPTPQDVRENRQPVLVRDEAGNVIGMMDPATGKMIAIADSKNAQTSNNTAKPAAAPAR